MIGSIGVFIGKFSLSGLYDKIGLNVESLQRGKNARMFSLNSMFSDTERRVVRKLIEDYYDRFVTIVSKARDRSFDQIHAVAQGRVWNGSEGQKIGLIDTLGGLDQAIDIAKDLAGISEEENIRLVYYPKSRSLFQSISRYLYVFDNPFGKLEKYISKIQSQPISLMPYVIEFQ